MNFWLIGAGVLAVVMIALVLVSMATVASFRCLASMCARNRQKRMRVAYGAAAVVSFVGLFVVAAIGFVGAATLLTGG